MGEAKRKKLSGKNRRWRIKAHDAFDKFWKQAKMKRSKAYGWLGERMRMSKEECHIGRFSIEDCKEVIKICQHGGNYYRDKSEDWEL